MKKLNVFVCLCLVFMLMFSFAACTKKVSNKEAELTAMKKAYYSSLTEDTIQFNGSTVTTTYSCGEEELVTTWTDNCCVRDYKDTHIELYKDGEFIYLYSIIGTSIVSVKSAYSSEEELADLWDYFIESYSFINASYIETIKEDNCEKDYVVLKISEVLPMIVSRAPVTFSVRSYFIDYKLSELIAVMSDYVYGFDLTYTVNFSDTELNIDFQDHFNNPMEISLDKFISDYNNITQCMFDMLYNTLCGE